MEFDLCVEYRRLVDGIGDRKGQVQISDGGAGRDRAETNLIGSGHFLLKVRHPPVGLNDSGEGGDDHRQSGGQKKRRVQPANVVHEL